MQAWLGRFLTPGVGAGRLLRPREAPRRASFLELFFDLAFILALNRVAQALEDDLTAGGIYRTALLLAAIWWVWFVTAWSTDWFDPRTPLIIALLIWVMLGGLLMAGTATSAYAGGALLFAGAYVAIHLGRPGLLLPALRGHPAQARTARVALWFVVSGALWLAGVFLPGARVSLWTAALVMEYSLAWLRWPTPGLGRSSWVELRITPEHLVERYQQIYIIALGEPILGAGIAFSQSRLDLPTVLAYALVFVVTISIGRLYLLPGGDRLAGAIEARGPSGSRLGLLAGYLHLVMIAGVVAIGLGGRLMVEDPLGRQSAALATLVAGPVLTIAGWIPLAALVHHRMSWHRLAGLLAIVIAAVLGHGMPLIANAAVMSALLLLTAHGDMLVRRRPRGGASRG